MILLSPLYKKFKNVASPQKFFRKAFIAAALTGFTASYGGAALIVANVAQQEWKKDKEFGLASIFSLNLVREHGMRGGLAVGLTYVGDAAIVYSLAGMAYWRSRKGKGEKLEKPATTPTPNPEDAPTWGREGAPPP